MIGIKKVRGIQGKLIVSFVMLTVMVTLITGIIQYRSRSEEILEDTKQQVFKLSAAAALLIDGDEHEKLTKEEHQLTDTYSDIKNKIIEFQKETGVTYIYTLVKASDNKTNFIIDADEAEGAALGDEYKYLPAMDSAFNGVAVADDEVYKDDWGVFLSGYAPIKNSEGKVVAIVGVDIDARHILERKNAVIKGIVINIVFSIGLTLILAILISKKIIKPIHYLVERFEELSMAGGDLTKRIEIKTGDELESLGQAITKFIGNIRDIVKQISDNAEVVSDSADNLDVYVIQTKRAIGEVTDAIQGIAQGATEQAGNVNDVTYWIKKIAIDINQNEDNINNINKSVNNTRTLISNGVVAVTNQNEKTEENLNAFNKVKDAVEKFTKEIKEVENILSTITNISNQTNLLALNAAIEAARAGEHGKGFSIVADEVRKLAEGSTSAVEEIGQILQRINSDSIEAIKELNNANLIAKEQKIAVDDTSTTFKEITIELEAMIHSIDIISGSFKEIAENTNTISDRIQEVSSVSQENAAIVEEVSASSEEQNTSMEKIGEVAKGLNISSKKLEEIILKFKI